MRAEEEPPPGEHDGRLYLGWDLVRPSYCHTAARLGGAAADKRILVGEQVNRQSSFIGAATDSDKPGRLRADFCFLHLT